jgi:hypothetical protein
MRIVKWEMGNERWEMMVINNTASHISHTASLYSPESPKFLTIVAVGSVVFMV